MGTRVSSDHPTVETISATLERHGGTSRPAVRLPNSTDIPTDEPIRLVVEETEYYAVITRRADGKLAITSVAETPRLVRNSSSDPNPLETWMDKRDLSFGRTVYLDVVEPGFRYGLRAPGESATYSTGRPDSGLQDIANSFDWDE